MNSKTQILVKLNYIRSCSLFLLEDPCIKSLHPRISALLPTIATAVDNVLRTTDNVKQRNSWWREAKRCTDFMKSLGEDILESNFFNGIDDPVRSKLYLVATMSHLMDDIATNSKDGHIVEELLQKIYEIEVRIKISCKGISEDDVRSIAGDFTEHYYSKMNRYT